MNFKIFLLFSGLLFSFSFPSQAQVINDNTLSTEVDTQNNRDFVVNGGEQRGSNLFHSFQEFSISNNGSVFFNNGATIQNIFSRVTGSSISEIRGAIENNGAANLFLINPNGIIFGENASLNIGGSFIGTTAESIVFADQTKFSANPTNSKPLLTVSVPEGLQFGTNPGQIVNQANLSSQDQIKQGLTTSPGKTLALLGSGVYFDGGAVTTPDGNIELGSVGENSFVSLKSIATGWEFGYDNTIQFQDLVFDNLASVDASGESGGNINVWGKNIKILQGSSITSDTLGDLNGGKIAIQASDLVEINGSDPTGQRLDPLLSEFEIFIPFASQISSDIIGDGKGGNIEISAENLQLIDGGAIELQALPESTGIAGDLFIQVENSIDLNGNRPLLGVGENIKENLILINPFRTLDQAIEVNQGSQISNISLGNSNSSGGKIRIITKNLTLENGGSISVSPFNAGNAGTINIKASESIRILGTSSRTGSASSIIASNTFSEGNSGEIKIVSDLLSLENGGQITSATSSEGNAGNISIDAAKVEIKGIDSASKIVSLISSESNNGGNGGDITIDTDNLTISNHASLSVLGRGSSAPGDLEINAKSVELSNFGMITAETESGLSGNVELNVEDNLVLRENSLISARATDAANGGNVIIDANFIIAFPQQNNDILASAVSGDGGNIYIDAQGVFGIEDRSSRPQNLTNDIDASSEFGSAGTVELMFPLFTAADGLFNLPSDFVDVNSLFDNSFCKISSHSRFVATGRGGIPLAPDQDLWSEQSWSDWRIIEETEQTEQTEEIKEIDQTEEVEEVEEIVMVQGWLTDAQGNVVLTDKPVSVTPRQSELNSSSCNEVQSSAP